MSNELKITPGIWRYDDGHLFTKEPNREYTSIAHIYDIYDNNGVPETNWPLIAASKDLYNALNKIHSECHKLLNRGTNEKLSVIDCLTIIGAIGETCEKPLKNANPEYKP